MKKAAVLLSVTGYAWYAVFAFNAQNSYPGLGSAIVQLALICLIPTLLGFFMTEKLLAAGPTMFKLLGLNLSYYLLYTVLASGTVTILVHKGMPGFWSASVFSSFWQLISWSLGAYPLIAAAESNSTTNLTALRSMEISLTVIPAVFLLTYMNFPPLVMLLVIISWFIALSLTLLTGGAHSQNKIRFRYDIILIHSLIPCLLAFALFLTAFSAEAYQMLDGFLRALLAFLVFLAKLLDSFFRLPPQTPDSPRISYAPDIPGEGPGVHQSSVLITVIFIALAAVLLTLAVRQLIKLLRKRITLSSDRPPVRTHSAFSMKGFLRQLLRLFVYLYRKSLNLFIIFQRFCSDTAAKVRRQIQYHLPPKTATEAVFRCYRGFLCWASRVGCHRRKHETPLEHFSRLQESVSGLQSSREEIFELTQHYQKTCYSKQPADWNLAKRCQYLLEVIKKTKLRGPDN